MYSTLLIHKLGSNRACHQRKKFPRRRVYLQGFHRRDNISHRQVILEVHYRIYSKGEVVLDEEVSESLRVIRRILMPQKVEWSTLRSYLRSARPMATFRYHH